MSEREGLYCEKHGVWCPDGACKDCAPVPLVAELAPLEPRFAIAVEAFLRPGLIRQNDAAQRPCDHASGYCKDTAHKYELPIE